MVKRYCEGYPRISPNIFTHNTAIDSHTYGGRVVEAEDMLLSMTENYHSLVLWSMDGSGGQPHHAEESANCNGNVD